MKTFYTSSKFTYANLLMFTHKLIKVQHINKMYAYRAEGLYLLQHKHNENRNHFRKSIGRNSNINFLFFLLATTYEYIRVEPD